MAVISLIGGITLGLLLCTAMEKLQREIKEKGRRKKVLFFGDSITQHGFNTAIDGWVSKMAEWWIRRVDVLNRGYSGYNSRWALLMIQEAVVKEDPDFVFIFFGANDSVDEKVVQHVPLNEYRQNIFDIANTIRNQLPKIPIVIITPPPIWEDLLQDFNRNKGKAILIDRTNERALQYADACKDVGKTLNIPVVNSWEAMEGFSSNRANYLSDGLHLSSIGNLKLFDAVMLVVLRYFPEWNPDIMEMQMPQWAQIDPTNPKFW